jgi:pimeloyl-ACP methyl ester carboxylesterase/cytochrome c-type biogenesis protein CcmH/NrfG
MSKKQSMLTLLALITVIANLEVHANSLDRFAIACVGQFAKLSRDQRPIAPVFPYTQLQTDLIVAQTEKRLSTHDQENESVLLSAIRQFEAKQYPEARAALEQLIGREPGNATAAFYLGRISIEQNKMDEAVKWFETAIRLDDKRAVHHHWLAQAYGKKARTGGMMSRASFASKARDALLKSLELDPGNLDARADLARYYNSVPGIVGGSAERAMEQVEFIKQRDALKGWLLAGELLADKRKFAEAERALLEAEKRQSDQFEATYKLGDFYQRTKEFDKAFAAFDRVLQSKPDDLKATYQIGRSAGMSGKNLDRGLTAFEAVKDRLPRDNHDALVGLHWWRGKIYEAKGEREKAYVDYLIVDRISPGYAETRVAIERTKPPADVAEAASAKRAAGLVSITPSIFASYAGETLECEMGRLLAPENRNKKNDRLLDIAFVRMKSASKTPQSPVIFLAGGPGASGIQTGRLPDYFQTIKAILEHADVILLDQRGAGASTPQMGCPGTVADLPATALRSREDMRRAFMEMARKCAEEKLGQGVDFDGFTILESADDVDDLRRALGLKKVSLWGHSSGTQLAFATLRRHEAAIDRLILMSVEGVANTEKLPSDVDRYFEQIAAISRRAATQVPDLMGLMRKVFMTLDRNPVTVYVTHPATGLKRDLIVGGDGLRMLMLMTAMNDTSSLPLIPSLFVTLSRGDMSGLAEMLSAAQGRGIPSADWFLIDGASGATASRREQIRREARASLFGDLVNFLHTDLRAVWNSKDLGDDFRKPVKSKVPALFISGTLDANTPPHRAEEARKGFPNSAHLIIENSGHQDALRSTDVIEVIAAFVQGRKIENKTFAMPAPENLSAQAGLRDGEEQFGFGAVVAYQMRFAFLAEIDRGGFEKVTGVWQLRFAFR